MMFTAASEHNFDLDVPLHNSEEGVRDTVGLLIVHKNSLLLVRSSANDPKGVSFTLPQGGVKKNESLRDAAFREGGKELRLGKRVVDSTKGIQPLGILKNPVPNGRKHNCVYKCIHYLFIPVLQRRWVSLNWENAEHQWIGSYDQLVSRVGFLPVERQEKLRALHELVHLIHKQGNLRWDCPTVPV